MLPGDQQGFQLNDVQSSFDEFRGVPACCCQLLRYPAADDLHLPGETDDS